MSSGTDFASMLRSLREQALPDSIVPSARRRATGMRRQEAAEAAGVSVDYVVRLEQGRSRRPSDEIVGALARALGADTAQTAALYQAAGYAPPTSIVNRVLDPSLQRLVARVGNVAAAAYSADWWILGWNDLWVALLGDPNRFSGPERNLVWQVFATDARHPMPMDRPLPELKVVLASDLRRESIAFPHDANLQELIVDLLAASPEFAAVWEQTTAARHGAERKTLLHPSGDLLLDADVFQQQGTGQKLIVYSAVPGTTDADALAKLHISPSAG